LSRRSKKYGILVWILFWNKRRKLGIHAQTLGTELFRGAQANARGATQVLDRGGQAAARGSWLSLCHRYLVVVPRPLPAAPFLVRHRYWIAVPRPLPAAPLAVRRTYLAVVLAGADACFSRQAHVLAVVAPPAPATKSASGVDAPLSTCEHVPGRGAQIDSQTVACGDATLPLQEQNTRQVSKRTG
jgi:hypothetical protein